MRELVHDQRYGPLREGAAEDLAALVGLQPIPATLSNLFPVPVLPKTC